MCRTRWLHYVLNERLGGLEMLIAMAISTLDFFPSRVSFAKTYRKAPAARTPARAGAADSGTLSLLCTNARLLSL